MNSTTRNPRIAVVILNWNGLDMLRRFLVGVIESSESLADVFVADNASTDASMQWTEQTCPRVGRIQLSENYGFAEGYNRALNALPRPYEYYLLLNNDVEPARGWIEPLLRFMDGHPEVAACQPKVLSWYLRDRFEYAGAAGGFIDHLGYPFCRGRLMNTIEHDAGQYDTPCHIFWATGAALLIRSADFHAVGGLDGRFFAHMEEVDLCWRLRARGRGIMCIPASRVWHVGGGTLSRSNPRKTYLNFRNNLLLLFKNLPDDRLSRVLRRRRLLDYIAAAKFALTGSWADARAVIRARRDFRRLQSQFAESRTANLAATTVPLIPEMLPTSLLWHYYARHRHTYQSIPHPSGTQAARD